MDTDCVHYLDTARGSKQDQLADDEHTKDEHTYTVSLFMDAMSLLAQYADVDAVAMSSALHDRRCRVPSRRQIEVMELSGSHIAVRVAQEAVRPYRLP